MPALLKNWMAPLGAILVAFLVSLVFEDLMNPYFQKIVIDSGIAIILAVSLNLVNGFTGQFSIGHAGFMAVGGYTTAFLFMNYRFGMPPDLAFFIYTLAGGLAAALAGLLVGLPSLRLKGDYLAIVTLGFGEIIRVAITNMESLGGSRGMYGIPKITGFFWVSIWAVITVTVVWRLIRSTHGRAFMSVREDEIAAEAMGVNTTAYKSRAFVLAAFFAGVGGSLFAHYLSYLNPSIFSFMRSIDFVIMVVLGGMGSISGSVIAAIILTMLPEVLRLIQSYAIEWTAGMAPGSALVHWVTKDYRMVIYSLLLVFLMLSKPKGLFGTSEIQDVWKKWFGKKSVRT